MNRDPSTPGEAPELYTVIEFAHLMRVHPETVRRWIASERVRAIRIGGEWRIPRRALEELLAL